MYTTPEEVMSATPYTDVTMAEVRMAQFIIEIFTGRVESEIEIGRDKSLLARATIAQCVYMRDKPDIAFQQIKVGAVSRGDGGESFSDDYSPFVAPLAAMACAGLSWLNSRSIKVGRTVQHGGGSPRDRWVRD